MWFTPMSDMIGLTMKSVQAHVQGEEMLLVSECGRTFKFDHMQDCCEYVRIESVDGDPADLIGAPLLMAEAVSSADARVPENEESYTWTFYKFATMKGYVTVRWLGTSNGCYSEEVDFREVRNDD